MTANKNTPPGYGILDGQLVIYSGGEIVATFPRSYLAHIALLLVKEMRKDLL